jgi:hypothetical protein
VIEFLRTALANVFARRPNVAILPQTVSEKLTGTNCTLLWRVVRITDALFIKFASGVLAPVLAIRLRLAVLLNAGLVCVAGPRGALLLARRIRQ